MPSLLYPYASIPGLPSDCSIALGIAINTLSGKSSGFIGILDTGADQTTLSKDLLVDLDVDPLTLQEIPIGGAEGVIAARYCDFIRIGLVELHSFKHYFPNGISTVPLHFSQGPFNLFGRQAFLDLCETTFNGPRQAVSISFS